MFTTYDSSKIRFPQFNGEHSWKCAELMLNLPFLLVIGGQVGECDGVDRTLMIRDADDLLSLNSIDGFNLKEGYLVSPAYINGGDGWEMKKITEVMQGYLNNGEREFKLIRYILSDQKNITINFSECDLKPDTEFRTIFKF